MPLLDESAFKTFLTNKRVVIVGPASTIEGSGQGSLIDSYDVVVRVNRAVSHLGGKAVDIGTRTDILYACMSTERVNQFHPRTKKLEVDADLWVHNKVRVVSEVYPRGESFYRASIAHNVYQVLQDDRVNLRHLPNENYFKVKEKVGCHLNSGLVALTDLLTHDIRELYITGIDFHRSIYMEGYETFTKESMKDMFENRSSHDPDKQFQYFKYEIFQKDDRVKVDEPLRKFLMDPKYEKTIDKG